MKSTFCVWTEDGVVWHCNPMAGEDASKDLLSMIDGKPQTYVEYGKWFYPADLPLEVVRQLADGVPVTKEMLAVALTGSDDVPGLFQLPDCGPDRVDLLPVDKGQTFQRIVPIFRQGEHLR